MTLVRRLGLAFAAMALALTFAGRADAVSSTTLDKLLDGSVTSLTLGDKTFDNFKYSLFPGAGATLPANKDITVTLSAVGQTYSITYTATSGSWNVPFGGNIGGGLSYDVTVTDPAFFIVGASTTGVSTVTGSGRVTLTENLYKNSDFTGFIDALGYENPNGPLPSSIGLAPIKKLTVQTVFAINTSGGTGTADLTSFTQSFSQAVPEPSSVALVGLGLATLGVAIRRRRNA